MDLQRFDFSQTLRKAATAAKQQEEQQEALLGSVMLRAAKNQALRTELQSNPTQVLQRESHGQLAPSIVAAADALLSQAIPGADARRVEDLVFNTVEDMRTSFRLTLLLSQWLFIAGLVMVAVAFFAALLSDRLWAVGVSGGAGVLSLLLSALRNPLDRIRNAAGNLTQIQAAYLGFYKQLYMLGGGMPSLSRADAVAYSAAIQAASDGMVIAVSNAIERGQAREAASRSRTGAGAGAERDTGAEGGAPRKAAARPRQPPKPPEAAAAG
ncbi:MAG: hypothetical protein WDN25_21700 [Acetobacteraceae bacterium]